jgi:hypothetical protein
MAAESCPQRFVDAAMSNEATNLSSLFLCLDPVTVALCSVHVRTAWIATFDTNPAAYSSDDDVADEADENESVEALLSSL